MTVLIEQFHIDIFIPQDLPPPEVRAVARTLGSRRFRNRLAAGVRRVVRNFPSLAKASLHVSR